MHPFTSVVLIVTLHTASAQQLTLETYTPANGLVDTWFEQAGVDFAAQTVLIAKTKYFVPSQYEKEKKQDLKNHLQGRQRTLNTIAKSFVIAWLKQSVHSF